MTVKLKEAAIKLMQYPIFAAALLILGSQTTSFLYQIVGDYLDGRWSGSTEIYIRDAPLPEGEPVYIFYASPRLFGDAKIVIPMSFNIVNEGKKPAKNVTMSLKYPTPGFIEAQADNATGFSGMHSEKDVTHDRNTNQDYTYSNHRLALMPPKDKMNFAEGVFAIPTLVDTPRYRTTGLGIDVKVLLSSETEEVREWNVHYRGVAADNNRGIASWLSQDYGQYVAIDIRKKDGFLKYLWGWIISKKVAVFSLSTRYGMMENGKLFAPIGQPDEYKGYLFSPYAKEFIFGD